MKRRMFLPVIVPRGSPLPSLQRPSEVSANLPAVYAIALKHYECQLELVNEQLDREWLAYIAGRSDLRYRYKTKRRLVYLEGMIARIKYIHLPSCGGPDATPTEARTPEPQHAG